MRFLWIVICFSFSAVISAQGPKTIYANEREVVALFFPAPISQALTGSDNFTFSYNRDSPQRVGVLQGRRGERSNLLVITEDGDIYSYGLAYRKVLDSLHYFVSKCARIGNEISDRSISQIDSLEGLGIPADYDIEKADASYYDEEHFRKRCSNLLARTKGTIKKKRRKGLVLKLRDVFYERKEVYITLEIENRSKIDFELDFLRLYKVNGRKSRKSSYQKQEIEPVYVFDIPLEVKAGEGQKYMVVLPKFTLGNSERLLFEMDELRGNRKLCMEVRRIE